MSLNILDYNIDFRPHLSYEYKVEFLNNAKLTRLVKSIKLPSNPINASDGRKRYGQTQVVLPFFEFGDKEIEISFIETDDMYVTDHLTSTLGWPNSPNHEIIIVTEYDYTLKKIIKKTRYEIALYSYNAPQWQNSGSASNTEVTATYVVYDAQDITADSNDIHELPSYVAGFDMTQELNVVGSSVDASDMSEQEWQKFLESMTAPKEYDKPQSGAPAGESTPSAPGQPQSQPQNQPQNQQQKNQNNSNKQNNSNPDVIRYKQGAKQNKKSGVDNLENLIKSGELKDAKGNTITDINQLKAGGKYFVNGHEYKAVKYGDSWSLNSNVKGKDYSYEKHANNPEEAYQNVTANGAVPYNLGAKSDGDISDGLDCMGFAGVVLQSIGADVVDKNGNKVKINGKDYKNVKDVFAYYSTSSFLSSGLKVVGPDGVEMKVLVAASGGTGHIVIEYGGYIYESAGGSGVRKTKKSEWKAGNHNYKDVSASETQVAAFKQKYDKVNV